MRYYLINHNDANYLGFSILAMSERDLNNGTSLLLFARFTHVPGLNDLPSFTKLEAYNYVKRLGL